jgi:tripartite-type tricarboxylate transporter receptor subunit TctC
MPEAALPEPGPESLRAGARLAVPRRRALSLLAAAAAWPAGARAQGLSDRPISFVVPFTPGSGPDVLGRLLAEELRKRWNQPVVVENKPGASGNIGTQFVARAAPDGQAILITTNPFVMNTSLFKSIPYDPQTSFVPLCEIATGTLALAVHPSFGAATVAAFVEKAKARPGAIDYASPGRGTPQHLAMELFKLTAKIDLKHIPFSGSAGAIQALTGAHVPAMIVPVHTALPLVEGGNIRLLAVCGPARSALAPDVPTFAELGYDVDVDLWYAALAPARTPPAIQERYNAAFNEILGAPEVRANLATQGLVPVAGPAQRLADRLTRDRPRWAKVIQDARIDAD